MNALTDDVVLTAQAAFEAAKTPADLENVKAQFLGKTGRITELMKGLSQLSVDDKKTQGAKINALKTAIEQALQARRDALQSEALERQLKAESLDVTLPVCATRAACTP